MQDYVKKQLFVAVRACLGVTLVGGGMGWSAPMVRKLQDPEQTPLDYVITDTQSSWVGSVLYIGTILGPYVSGYLSNRFGRKPCLFLGAIISCLAFVLKATAVNLAMIFAGRILTGLGTSIIYVIALVYVGEIASTNIRGILLTSIGMFSTFGTLFVFSTAPFVSYAVASYIILAIVAVYTVGLFFIPESPVFYVMNDREDEAHQSMMALGRTDPADFKRVLSSKEKKPPSFLSGWQDLFVVKSNRMALTITMTLSILQQMSGVMAVIIFATNIFEMAGSTIQPDIATIVIGITQFAASCITPIFVDRTGRKGLLLVSTFICFLSLSVLGAYFLLDYQGYELTVVGWLPLVTLIMLYIGYDMGFGIIPAALVGEMFSNNARSSGSTLAITVSWLFGFGVSTAFAYLVDAIGSHFTFWIFAGACAGAFFFTLFVVPETKGKTLVEVQEMLSK